MKAGVYNEKEKLITQWDKLVSLGIIVINTVNLGKVYSNHHKLVIPDDIEKLSYYTLEDSQIKKIILGKNVKSVESSSFDSKYLEYIEVHPDNPYFVSEDGILFNKDKTRLIRFPEANKDIIDYTIPDSVVEINDSAFFKCINLEHIKMSNNVKRIGAYGIASCKELKDIKLSNNLEEIDDYGFHACENLEEVKLYEKLKILGTHSFSNCSSLKEITLPSTLKKIGFEIFHYSRNIETIKYTGKKGELMATEGQFYLNCDLYAKKRNIIYDYKYTLEELIECGKTLKDINKMLKKQENLEK